MGLLDRARDAYSRAKQLDPTNETYESNFLLADEKLKLVSKGVDPNVSGPSSSKPNTNKESFDQEFLSDMLNGKYDLVGLLRNPQVVQFAVEALNSPQYINR